MKPLNIILLVSIPVIIVLSGLFIAMIPTLYHLENFKDYQPDNYPMAKNVILAMLGFSGLNNDGFDDREIMHLKDVRHGFVCLQIVYLAAIAVLIISAALGLKKKLIKKAELMKVFLKSSIASLSVIALLVVFLLAFSWTFDYFHLIFFRPGTYMFSPDSLIITLFPFDYFRNAFFAIIIFSSIISLGMLFYALFATKKNMHG